MLLFVIAEQIVQTYTQSICQVLWDMLLETSRGFDGCYQTMDQFTEDVFSSYALSGSE